MSKVLVVGGGAAGLLAGIAAATYGAQVIILEKMFRPGKKLLITGKGRCNITNNCELPELIANITGNGRFLNSVFRQFSNDDMIQLLNENGLETKIERGGRVFPISDQAKDVVDTLLKILKNLGAEIITDISVTEILVSNNKVIGVKTKTGKVFNGDAVIIATGGASYPGTGSDGSGFKLAEKIGHKIISLKPSLVPLTSDSPCISDLQGLSLRNVEASIYSDKNKIASEFGEMLFTHFGVSGPIILSLSRTVSTLLSKNYKDLDLVIDLKPALTSEKLDDRVQRDFTLYTRKKLVNGIKDLLPQRLIPVVLDQAYLEEEKPINQISKEERKRLVETLKGLSISITGTRSIAEAIVTAGGVDTKEINPKTMQSKLIEGLYFAGEVIDVDGYTGGYNLQAAFSTGYAAGVSAAQQ